MAEGAPLLREYGLIAHRGFESLSLRHVLSQPFTGLLASKLSRDKHVIKANLCVPEVGFMLF